ncbi:hypothetical protein [Lacticaseibacillus pantheris]|uniref:hypothetical protein n=1 Tax=Lacticaseibacillus pantheris TaxID=171523 RepID=UPI00265A077F|nr:hypothetical protein [Lacticaseibacillus pantheris]WKF86017.1 hypothetical protein QY874_05405 [Lacticaseibacillus pantheris]
MQKRLVLFFKWLGNASSLLIFFVGVGFAVTAAFRFGTSWGLLALGAACVLASYILVPTGGDER